MKRSLVQPASYTRADSVEAAVQLGWSGATFYGGGTSLVDLMKLGVTEPSAIVDISRLPLGEIDCDDAMLRLGASVRMSHAAESSDVLNAVPAIAQALSASASGQLRNMATLGGNILQRTRCAYFRDTATPCNKRTAGSGCSALRGLNDEHAVLGTSESCIAVHASDFAVVIAAFDTFVTVTGPLGSRSIPVADFFVLPGDTPQIETTLGTGELITAIEVTRTAAAANSAYVKVRDRTSYAFALASCAAGMERAPDGSIADVRIALGGVATIPWRARSCEDALRGNQPTRDNFAAAAAAAFEDARPTVHNTYKVDLASAAIVRALEAVTA